MAKISRAALTEIQQALADYSRAVEASVLAETSKKTHIDRAERFVPWLNDEYSPAPPALRRT